MRHLSSIPFVLCLVSFLGLSKSVNGQGFNAGFRVGFNATQIDGDGMGGFNHAGGTGGIFVNYPYKQVWEFGFEMMYSGKGSKRISTIDYQQTGAWDQVDLHYIEVPVLAGYRITNKIRVQAGLAGGYLFSVHAEGADPDYFRKYEVSFTAGADYRFAPKWAVYARYSNSIIPIGSNEWFNYNNIYNVANGSLINFIASFGLIYHFNEPANLPEKPSAQ